jgi:hypothetical protein
VGGPSGQGSHDPNDKLIGVGTGEFMHITPDTLIPYTIRFENDENVALASVQLLTITDPLPDNLDWSTFELGDMEFWHHLVEVPPGLTYFHHQVDIRDRGEPLIVDIEAEFDPDTGIVEWVFTGLDPATMELTFDVDAGFLPPNNENSDGEGCVKFQCAPKADLPDGTVIENIASIVFDWNEPMDTPRIFNTIDRTAPTSSVTALPVESPSAVPVTWTGTDNDGGAGIAVYDVYVSADGGATYTAWLRNTPATGGTYPGVVGQSYSFYCVATDWVGLQEQKLPTAEATTIARAVPTIQLTDLVDGQVLNAGDTLRIEWSDDDPDSDASIGLYWDTDLNLLNNGAAGRDAGAWGVVVEGLSEDDETDAYNWLLPADLPGTWLYVFATAKDSVGQNTDYSSVPFAFGDADMDGMLDSWEQAAVAVLPGIDTIEQFLPGADSDGDGWTNLQEFEGGSDPADPNSGLDWQFTLYLSGATLPSLTIGYADGATHEWDALFDIDTSETSAYLVGPGGSHARLLKSIVAPGSLPRWDVVVSPIRQPIQVAWDPANVPLNYGLFLTEVGEARGDGIAESVDMVALGSTSLNRTATYAIELAPPVSVTLNLVQGWNLVSLPVQPADSSVAAVFGDLVAPPFGWPTADGVAPLAYQARQSVTAGEGMWLYWDGTVRDKLTVVGRPVRSWSHLIQGWNLVGPTAEVALPGNPAIGGPVWWYNTASGAYEAVEPGDSLLPGNGYWIFALEETVLDLTD